MKNQLPESNSGLPESHCTTHLFSAMVKSILITIFLLGIFGCTLGQSNTNSSVMRQNIEARPGTYQFIYHPSKFKYVFTNDILIKIEKNRDRKEIKHINVAPDVEVMILPKDSIDSPYFVPIEEKKYVTD